MWVGRGRGRGGGSLVFAGGAGFALAWRHARASDGQVSAAEAQAFVPVTPTRVVDTRQEGSAAFGPGKTRTIAFAALVPVEATSVSVALVAPGSAMEPSFSRCGRRRRRCQSRRGPWTVAGEHDGVRFDVGPSRFGMPARERPGDFVDDAHAERVRDRRHLDRLVTSRRVGNPVARGWLSGAIRVVTTTSTRGKRRIRALEQESPPFSDPGGLSS